ncbi:hypothetical protein O3P69_016383 [Scylla paramamosain]|uniref:Uncharacterized protein n=1 Tax=Scylla paramamosain TaxID=85552 RepID=A0AAW0TDD0_SCYPA
MRRRVCPERYKECGPPADTDICAIPITLQSLGSSANYAKYNAWREEDHYMDWFGAESDQGQYQGIPASGSPMAWTTNQPGFDGYQDLNIYGEDYWMMKLEVDCSSTDNGWFEIKGWLEFAGGYSGWEIDIQQGLCGGAAGGLAPSSSSTNHKARGGNSYVDGLVRSLFSGSLRRRCLETPRCVSLPNSSDPEWLIVLFGGDPGSSCWKNDEFLVSWPLEGGAALEELEAWDVFTRQEVE